MNRFKIFPVLIISTLALTVSLCRPDQNGKELHETFLKEIQNRRSILKSMSKYDDSLLLKCETIHNEILNLILLSKDVENLNACVNKSEAYFSLMESKYPATIGHYLKISPSVNSESVETQLLENELMILNNLIFINSGAEVQLLSASGGDEPPKD